MDVIFIGLSGVYFTLTVLLPAMHATGHAVGHLPR